MNDYHTIVPFALLSLHELGFKYGNRRKNLIGKIKGIKITKGNQNTLLGEIITKFDETNYAA